MGTATLSEGSHGLRNHIEVDLVRRAADGQEPEPESYLLGEEVYSSFAELITSDDPGSRRAVILATLGAEALTAGLRLVDNSIGEVTLQQLYGSDGNDVLRLGQASAEGAAYRATAAVPGTSWQVSFTPSQTLLQRLTISSLPLHLALLLALAGVLAGLLLVALWLPRLLTWDVERILSDARLKSRLHLTFPPLVPLGRLLRRLYTGSLPFEADVTAASAPLSDPPEILTDHHLTDPLFQNTSMLDEEDAGSAAEHFLELELEEDSSDGTGPGASQVLAAHIFRAYDVRGHAETELNDSAVGLIGRALGTLAAEKNEAALLVACDGRHSSPRIRQALVQALLETGRNVIDIGIVPTPLLYFATRHLNCSSGVMITGSHNPAADNGLKIILKGHTMAASVIQRLRECALEGNFCQGEGRLTETDILPAYIDEVVGDIAIPVPLKLVIDAGNGATSEIAPRLFTEMGCEVVPLYCTLDGSFPNRPPDTSREENLSDLVAAVTREQADFGVAFDGDGDRLAVVSGSGEVLRTDLLLMIFAEDVVARNPGTDVVFDVKCSRNLARVITKHGGRPVLWKTGHAFMKEKMAETGALLGGEFSGHIFFGERWYGFDDGMYAAARLAEIISNMGETLTALVAALPASTSTPEILIPVPESKKFALVRRFIEQASFPDGKINTLDGIRVDFNYGWGLLRASNTGPALTARFEASDPQSLQAIMNNFRSQLAEIEPELELTF
ncbi:phosphomannomutase/phosphoglucomutase [Kineobactrum salinum]|uniref:phosphomannomutase n=2 Tax=Kineobactrum salinum TaxID=2708301 RepID=A0A6C0U6B0_9GAMM|nr:phosphomannomutase/phosphoglucomutase [Kineobactrum salinum]